MPQGGLPKGQLFSQVYLKRGPLAQDSERMRHRIAALYILMTDKTSVSFDKLVLKISLSLGIKILRVYGNVNSDFHEFMKEAELRDVLDVITLIYNHLPRDRSNWEVRWREGIQQIFEEEKVTYRIYEEGGVHLGVDEEFDHNRASVISSLSNSRYSGVITAFNEAHKALDSSPPDGKLAMRHAFEAVEILFRLIFPNAPRLGGSEIKKHLEPWISAHLAEDKTAARATIKLLASFSEWVDGVHFYRHGQGQEEPVQPPLSLAILTISTAASYLRWLGELDPAVQGSAA